ncbi:SLOG family protein [Lysinibacillus fusiformis]|uniref:SLOG family protein n=1 Tax=Lysinibacillus fusiformis TaxID=28031 RepID=UPI00263A8A24|nr:SLOG family protein [Lysinibacillus fusiformis]MDC6267305.1 SLOG family protein [Lysinibacillus sphaericus]MDN4968261.1 SLOG family protein [Lysinibacillus fusiformis]MDN4968435.1 SLOG family protein [Lysinibacillus fusiformis]
MSNTACFTGHRPNKLNGYDPKDNSELLFKLRDIIMDHVENRGVNKFISGMALGIDMWAARIVLKLKEKYPHIKLVCAIPCDKQYSKWFQISVDEWHDIIAKADEVVYVSKETYTSWCMQKRNEYMVDNSDYIIAIWDETKGGTGNCVKYAQGKSKHITILHPKTLIFT